MEVLKVSSATNAPKLAGALTAVVREDGGATMQCIGAGAVNQAVKATAIARGFLAPQGIEICILPGFKDISVGGSKKTSVNMEVRRL